MGIFRKTAVAEAVPESEEATEVEPLTVTRQNAVVEISDWQFRKYQEKARGLGFTPAALQREELMRHLKANDIGVYTYNEVARFLDSEFGKSKTWQPKWGWRAFVEKDVGQSDLVNWEYRNSSAPNGTIALPNTYQGKIPFEVLNLIGDVREALPFVGFFVSDVPTRKEREQIGDPFLAISWIGLEEIIVIAQWDEPKFFGEPIVPE